MRRERLYLQDIVDAADAMARFVLDVDRPAFLSSDLHQSAVPQKLMVIGEAVACLPDTLKRGHPEVEWGRIVAFRNLIIHRYFRVDWDIIWTIATVDVPSLRALVAGIIAHEFPDAGAVP